MKKLLLTSALLLATTAQADISLTVAQSTPTSEDTGNEIRERDINFTGIVPVYATADKKNSFTAGLMLQSNVFKFDDANLPEVDLLKVKLPIGFTHVQSERLIWQATLLPGVHGESNDLSEGEYRVEGTAMAMLPRGDHVWVLGLGYGDVFGEPKVFAVMGAIWKPVEAVTLNLVLPALEADIKVSETFVLTGAIEPAGGQWIWKQGALGNQYEGDITLTGSRMGVGGEWSFAKGTWLTFRAGLESGREFEVKNAVTGQKATAELESSAFAQLGIEFK